MGQTWNFILDIRYWENSFNVEIMTFLFFDKHMRIWTNGLDNHMDFVLRPFSTMTNFRVTISLPIWNFLYENFYIKIFIWKMWSKIKNLWSSTMRFKVNILIIWFDEYLETDQSWSMKILDSGVFNHFLQVKLFDRIWTLTQR